MTTVEEMETTRDDAMPMVEEASTSNSNFQMKDTEVVDEEVDYEGQEDIDYEEVEGEEDIEDDEYRLRFDGEMNPLDFIKDNASGIQLYQQFERLEYEALAEKKRKALNDRPRDGSAKKARHEDDFLKRYDEIMEGMNLCPPRKGRKHKKKGRRKGSSKRPSPEVTKKLGEGINFYAKSQYEEAKCVLNEAIKLAPNFYESYQSLGFVYEDCGENKDIVKAMNFYMLAAHLAPKDQAAVLWKRLVCLSIDQGNTGQATYCLSKAIRADPDDMSVRFQRASLYNKLGNYQKAAETYDSIVGFCPENVEAREMSAKMHQKCGRVDKSISILEDYIKERSKDADWSVINLLATIHMENNDHAKALQQIEHASSNCSPEEFPLHLNVMAGICHAHLGNIEKSEDCFKKLLVKQEPNGSLIKVVADTFMNLGRCESALKYYFLLEGIEEHDNGDLHLKIAQCYVSLKERSQAIAYFYKSLRAMEENISGRLTLASLLLEEERNDEAIMLLSPPKDLVADTDASSKQSKPWWSNGKVRMQLAQIYHARGMLEDFVQTILSSVQETMFIESLNQKVRPSRRLSKSVLCERVKLLDGDQTDNVFSGFKPPEVTPIEMLKATRAKKSLEKKAAMREKNKAAVIASGLEWHSDDSEEECPREALREPPLPNLLKDDEHYQLILNLCKALASLCRYSEALEIIDDCLRLVGNRLQQEKKEELKSLGAQIAFNTTNPSFGYDYARDLVLQNPKSISAWNCYYKIISRFEDRLSKHSKFLRMRRRTHSECVPPKIISGHQLTAISQHQAAAKEYLEAYKLQPDNPLINLCVGTALINLALGHRLQNKHQCVAQGFAFLFNYLRLCKESQESLYNIARACQHVGLVTLAVSYYEKVLAMRVIDYPLPKLPNEDLTTPETKKEGYCDLRREAAYNLHMIYKKSGAVDLARQVLKDHCTP